MKKTNHTMKKRIKWKNKKEGKTWLNTTLDKSRAPFQTTWLLYSNKRMTIYTTYYPLFFLSYSWSSTTHRYNLYHFYFHQHSIKFAIIYTQLKINRDLVARWKRRRLDQLQIRIKKIELQSSTSSYFIFYQHVPIYIVSSIHLFLLSNTHLELCDTGK